jgi:hypothetical protein
MTDAKLTCPLCGAEAALRDSATIYKKREVSGR